MSDQHRSQAAQPRRLTDFDVEIDRMDRDRASLMEKIRNAAPEHALLIQQADWHLTGLLYHLRRIRTLYEPATKSVADMAAGDPAGNILITTAPEMQQLMFEFYAFISLARITLDQLLRFAGPSLTMAVDQRPNSVTEVLKWQTDFPVFVELANSRRTLAQYLIDIRDCIVHHRTFATSEGVVAVQEGFPEDKVPDMAPMWFRGVVRTYFRRLGGKKVSVNITLPNAISEYRENGEKIRMLPTFEYGDINLLSQSRSFAELCLWAVLATLAELDSDRTYELRKLQTRRR